MNTISMSEETFREFLKKKLEHQVKIGEEISHEEFLKTLLENFKGV